MYGGKAEVVKKVFYPMKDNQKKELVKSDRNGAVTTISSKNSCET